MLSPVGYRLHGSISDYIYVCYSCVLLRTEVFLSAFLFSLNVLWRCSTIGKKDNNIQINEEIRDKELRVITAARYYVRKGSSQYCGAEES